jgi:cobalt-zinc-cadmium efflux system protein
MTRRARLLIVLGLNLVLIAGLVAVGIAGHSVGLLAAGGDYLADSGAIALALLAIWLRDRPTTARRPQGYPRATAYAALVNAGLLLLVVVLVFFATARRLVTGTGHVHGLPVMLAAVVAGTVMVAGAMVLGGDLDQDDDTDADRANMRAVLLDTIADAAAAAGVAIAGLIILVTGGWFWLDPTVALIISAVIGYHVVLLLRDAPALCAAQPRRSAPGGDRSGHCVTDASVSGYRCPK